jgi:hypothetical protein
MVLLSPTAQQAGEVFTSADRGTHDTEWRLLVVPDACDIQVTPPSVLARIVPPSPTAQQSLASGHETPLSEFEVPDDSVTQVVPSVVLIINPPSPTATQSTVVGQETPSSGVGVVVDGEAAAGSAWVDQFWPSDVAIMK